MISLIDRKNWLWIKSIVLTTIAIPLVHITYELLILGKQSIVFLAAYPEAVSILVILYYVLLLIGGVGWIILQLKSLLILRKEKNKAELLHLQSQVNPHFFFNMLNNLYGIVDKDIDKSKALILKLSELMRYSIYEGEKKWVSLEEEIAYLKNYIALHQMRYHKSIAIRFTTDIKVNNVKIMPLLYIILLENAFKHGAENLREGAYIYIDIQANKKTVDFKVENNFDGSQPIKSKGIGLKNLKRRLALAYPEKHKLTIINDEDVFISHLIVQK
ncbi:sensor histidine kinase [Aquimarina sp. W85]|uniref:sensor histidine kinase n=1 Tax=Aquimarina rhodophyticola TaxID=3342246 RepID=UPI0036705D13